MNTIKFLTLAVLFIGFTSCSSDDDNGTQLLEVESELVSNLQATQSADYTTNPPTITGEYIKFSFETGATTTGDDWDIAFRGSTIIVNGGEATATDQPSRTGNGGAYIATGTLASVTSVDETLFNSDSSTSGLAIPTGSGSGWYNYNPTTHVISPIAGKIIVVKTNDGKYAKVEILSYYENGEPNAELSNSQFYTFNYVYQPNAGLTTF
ncbi:HmuY family protein [Subsaxibacter sp. CAU 1640]|uniref:HmuY family protein n=1 Tax=Subsaxibacter sp. CAU 1640 TaxID=2933271 RepID=UPI002002ECF5|nr:HmuY family protein [Subsaxibacter sp. CAU 1640]MCK7589323.1 HmuY family protein [Subsaxibacter sp. CAU 1640]